MTAWLLLLLGGGESYGWALLAALRERGLSVDQSSAYRTLRHLERDGAAASHWMDSSGGPRRRAYRLTPAGRRTLDRLAAQIVADCRQEETFLRARQRALAREGAGRVEPATDGPDPPAQPSEDRPHSQQSAPEQAGDDGASIAGAAAPRASRELTAGWLLLLLEDGATYGYDLRRRLKEHNLHPDPGAMYRLLRELDRAGWVQSRWMQSVAGPRRRLYRIRAKGRRNLDDLSSVISASRDRHIALLLEYEKARG